jgi:polyhydroxybutyrate depolymerase
MHQKSKSIALAMIVVLILFPLVGAMARTSLHQTMKHTLLVGDLMRTYYLHVPPSLPKDRALALVLMFHGGGGTPAFAERESRFSDLADQEGFLVAYPQGFGKSWNDGRGVKAIPAQRDDIDDVGFVAALIDDASRIHKIDPKRIYATGISNGAIFSHYLADKLSSRIAAIAPVAGGMPESLERAFKPGEPVSVLILNGTKDPIVPYLGGDIALLGATRGRIIATEEAASKWAAHNHCESVPTLEVVADKNPNDGCLPKKLTYANCKVGTEVVLYRMEGAGHTWPDGLQYLPQRLVGKVCRDINGAEIIWEFFKGHAKP